MHLPPAVPQMIGRQSTGAAAAGSSSTDWGIQSPVLSPLVDCLYCRVQLVQIRSKQRATYGETFVKCPNNIKVSQFLFNFEFLDVVLAAMVTFRMVFMQDDPTTCGIIMSEVQYEIYLRNPEKHAIRSKKLIPFSSGNDGHGSMDCILEQKQEVDAMNQKIDSAVTALWEFKVQVQRVKMDYIVIVVVCVGVAVGCLLSKIKQSLWSFCWS
jgi:hypothetical protein